MKMRQDNDVTDLVGPLYAENETELSWLIQYDMVYGGDQTWQRRDWSYMCDLLRNQNLTVMNDQTGCGLLEKKDRTTMWLIVEVWSPQNTILTCQDWSDIVWSTTKTTQDNDVIDHIGLLYAKEIELSWSIWKSTIYDEI